MESHRLVHHRQLRAELADGCVSMATKRFHLLVRAGLGCHGGLLDVGAQLGNEALNGAKHSPPGGKFQKSEDPPVAGPETPFH